MSPGKSHNFISIPLKSLEGTSEQISISLQTLTTFCQEQTLNMLAYLRHRVFSPTRTRHPPLYPGLGHGGGRLSRDTQTSLSPDASSSSSRGSPRRSQASRET
ncbi:hypothetical protein XENOCAPTIV_020931 [Xenoophorus captivus]|uniref:Uncharacterized protein n=1 Tax=Xenoophorus captivus TaxID=1517983 RepID=A0ABV0QB19_9TELE